MLNDTLGLEWQRFYGADVYYGLWDILATSDGGCLLGGTQYEWWNNDYHQEIVSIKTDSLGLIPSSDEGVRILVPRCHSVSQSRQGLSNHRKRASD
jgi:hypothetical protein